MPEFQPGAHFNNDKPNEGKRNFLRRVFVGAAAIAVGDKYLINKSTNKNEESISSDGKKVEGLESVDDLFKHFKGQERNYVFAEEAAISLIKEMGDDIPSIRLSGSSHSNNRIEILRSYLSYHLNIKGIGDKYPSQKQILASGFFTKENLTSLSKEAQELTHKHHIK